jgi:hypothetical protein
VSINTSDYVGHDDFQFGGVGLVGPTADAGPDQAIVAGETVLLDGSASFDDNTASSDLSYSWSLTQRPVGSNAFLVNPNMPLSSFVADVSGEYRATLIVTDEDGLSSDPDELVITSANARPMANAGGDQAGVVGFATVLDGSMSGDPNGDPITFAWSFQQIPTGSSAFLAATATANPHFIPDLPGVYTVELVVNDGLDDSDPDLVEVAVISGAEFAEFQLGLTIQWVSDLPVSWFTTKGNQMALTRHLTQALVALQNGNTGGALDKIEKALDRMDGCVLRGAPDGNGPGRDWIVDCSAQLAIYEALTQARDAIVV